MANSDDFSAKWGWYSVIYNLSNGDVTKINEVTRLNANECFTFLCYSKDLNSMQNNGTST